jgi:ankyrin repeat protein
MHLAAENGHATIIELLADKYKASIFERTKDGSTLMHIASLNGHAECAMMLFKKGVYLHMPNKVTFLFVFQWMQKHSYGEHFMYPLP